MDNDEDIERFVDFAFVENHTDAPFDKVAFNGIAELLRYADGVAEVGIIVFRFEDAEASIFADITLIQYLFYGFIFLDPILFPHVKSSFLKKTLEKNLFKCLSGIQRYVFDYPLVTLLGAFFL